VVVLRGPRGVEVVDARGAARAAAWAWKPSWGYEE
jgi:hypothetical protein